MGLETALLIILKASQYCVIMYEIATGKHTLQLNSIFHRKLYRISSRDLPPLLPVMTSRTTSDPKESQALIFILLKSVEISMAKQRETNR